MISNKIPIIGLILTIFGIYNLFVKKVEYCDCTVINVKQQKMFNITTTHIAYDCNGTIVLRDVDNLEASLLKVGISQKIETYNVNNLLGLYRATSILFLLFGVMLIMAWVIHNYY